MTPANVACTLGQKANKLDHMGNIRKQTEKTRFDSCGGAWSQRGPRVEITNFAVEITNFAVETPNFAVVPRTLKIHTKSFEISFVDKKMCLFEVVAILVKWWNNFVISMVGGLLTAALAVLQGAPCLLGRDVLNENQLHVRIAKLIEFQKAKKISFSKKRFDLPWAHSLVQY